MSIDYFLNLEVFDRLSLIRLPAQGFETSNDSKNILLSGLKISNKSEFLLFRYDKK